MLKSSDMQNEILSLNVASLLELHTHKKNSHFEIEIY